MDAVQLAALLSSKLCHDLVGPVGAASNGLDLIEDGDSVATQVEALALARSSIGEAVRRLKFFRLAFGAESPMTTPAEARRLSEGPCRSGRPRAGGRSRP
ncbi:MAG: hypothetical protein FJX65_18635 [Alphaproteobacteria bacterium]|nr:hypothetical protein [Alphaproteobacteria bacterium]